MVRYGNAFLPTSLTVGQPGNWRGNMGCLWDQAVRFTAFFPFKSWATIKMGRKDGTQLYNSKPPSILRIFNTLDNKLQPLST